MKNRFAAFLALLALNSLAIEDFAKKTESRDEVLKQVWPKELSGKPSKELKACVERIMVAAKIEKAARSFYEAKFLSQCRFNEYRMSIFLECTEKLASEMSSIKSDASSYCSHAHNFSKNQYVTYQSCMSTLRAKTDLPGATVSSLCEQTKGDSRVVDCLVVNVGRGLELPMQFQKIDDCLKPGV
jgi:hypothetical protein